MSHRGLGSRVTKLHDGISDPFPEFPDAYEAELKRTCPCCGEYLERTKFSKTDAGRLHENCDLCRGSTEPIRAERKKKQTRMRAVGKLVAEAAKNRIHIPTIVVLCQQMYKLHDGVENFCLAWKEDAYHTPEGSKRRMDYYEAIIRLTGEANKLQRKDMDWDTVSEKELETAIEQYLDLRIYHGEEEEDGNQPDVRTA